MKRSNLMGLAVVFSILSCLGNLSEAVALEEAKKELPSGVSDNWLKQVQDDIRRSEYNVTFQERTYLEAIKEAYQALNRGHRLRTYFLPDGIRVISAKERTPTWIWGLSLTGYGYRDEIMPLGPAELKTEGSRVEYLRNGITEWYLNDQKGLEQGFTLLGPLSSGSGSSSHLALAMALKGNVTVEKVNERQLRFISPGGVGVVNYGNLSVRDREGKELSSWIEARPGEVLIIADVRNASFPVTIDPLATSPSWMVESDWQGSEFGYSVSTAGDVNGDGYDDVIIAALNYYNGYDPGDPNFPYDDRFSYGRAYVYHGSTSGLPTTPNWTAFEWCVLSNGMFGYSVSTAGDVNADGYSDVIIGSPDCNNIFFDNEGYHFWKGRAHVYHGSSSGLSATPNWTGNPDFGMWLGIDSGIVEKWDSQFLAMVKAAAELRRENYGKEGLENFMEEKLKEQFPNETDGRISSAVNYMYRAGFSQNAILATNGTSDIRFASPDPKKPGGEQVGHTQEEINPNPPPVDDCTRGCSVDIPVAEATDPNIKITVGYGDQGFITGDSPLLYTIYFENIATATAAAQQVFVTDQLSTDLEWSTFELVEIAFNDAAISVPSGYQNYATQASVSTDPNPVSVIASFDANTGTITWTMQSVDLVTGQLPEDPFAGFLPPNKPECNHCGEGHVSFIVWPKSGLVSGTTIPNQASVVFDVNAPIDTGQIINTIDDLKPTSTVNGLPATTNTANFSLSWTGSDNTGGSGISFFDIYVSVDGGAFTLWEGGTTQTSATYNGANGHTYGFYSVATDNVGNRQDAPAGAQASTTIVLTVNSITVASPTGRGDIILSTDTPGCSFSNVQVFTEAQLVNDPLGDYPYGLVGFTLNCAAADVSITYTGATSLAGYTYRKYGPTTPGNPATTQWYTFNNVTLAGNTVILHLQDGQLGDDTGVDGIIVDKGGPAEHQQPIASIPTVNEWGMLILITLLGLMALHWMRRAKGV